MSAVSECYKVIRGYIHVVTKQNYSDIDGYVADALELGEKTVRNIVNGKRPLKDKEDFLIANAVINNYYNNKRCNKERLKELVADFLQASNPYADSAEINKQICEITGERYYECAVRPYGDSSYDEPESKAEASSRENIKIYSNVPNSKTCTTIVRTASLSDICRAIDEGEIVYLDGMIGMGKKYVASSYILKCKNDGQNKYTGYIWNQKRTNESFTFDDLIRNILVTFNKNMVTNLNTDEKEKEAILELKKHRSLIVIEDFHAINPVEQNKILGFLLNEFESEDISVILISNQRLDSLKNVYSRYAKMHEVRIKQMSTEENLMYCEIIAQNKETVQKAKLIYDDIFSFVYKVCGGHPFATDIVLNSMAHSLVRGVDVEELKKKYSVYKLKGIEANDSYGFLTELVSNIFGDMPAQARRVLLALCLLEAPASVNELYEITGIDGLTERGTLKDDSSLSNAIECCLKNSFVESVIINKTVRFEIAPFLRGVVPREIESIDSKDFEIVVKSWLDYILNLSKEKMGFKFDDFQKLNEMDAKDGIYPFSNVTAALNYCWDRGLWDYYYDISYQSRYYIYTRSISGKDKESIHYKRAVAARNIQNPDKEVEALLYHTNVCCKIDELETVEECFARIEDLIADYRSRIKPRCITKFLYTKALYACEMGEYDKSISLYNEYEGILKDCLRNPDCPRELEKKFEHDFVASLRWHSYCLYKKACKTGCPIPEATKLLNIAISMARTLNFTRATAHAIIIKVKIMLDLEKDIEKAKSEFQILDEYMSEVDKDYIYLKDYKYLKEKLCG